METGLNYEKISSTESNVVHPTLLLKYGFNDVFELRLIAESVTNRIDKINSTGLTPMKIGFKVNAFKERGIIPLTSFIAHLSIPALSSKNFRETYYAPSFRFSMQHTITEKISAGYNLGAEWDGETPEPVFIYTLTTGLSLSEKVGAYAEIYGFAPQKNKADHRADAGFTYLLSQNILIDLSGGIGLTSNAPDYYGALGFSFRVPVVKQKL